MDSRLLYCNCGLIYISCRQEVQMPFSGIGLLNHTYRFNIACVALEFLRA